MYFKEFQTISYGDFDIKNIAQRVKFIEIVRENDRDCSDYLVQDGETPESLAQDFYGNPQLDWIIILLNNIIDPFNDWVLDTNTFEKMIRLKYDNPDAIRHRVSEDGRIFQPSFANGVDLNEIPQQRTSIVTHRQWEEQQNERKRRIRIARPELISRILERFHFHMKKQR